MANQTYDTFIKQVKEISCAEAVAELLGWDQETYMPKRGTEARAEQLAFMAGLSHTKLTSDELGALIGALENEGDRSDFVAATNVREMRRRYDRAVKIPKDLVERIAKASALAKPAWAEARKEADFAKFAPHLQTQLELKREEADCVGWDTEPYDALLDEYEPGAQAAEVQEIFDGVKAEQVPLVAAIKDAPRKPDTSIMKRDFPRDGQEAFGRKVAAAMGFDFEAGRLDVSTHPFCSGTTPLDVRLTTRYDEHWLPGALFGVMHEAGHGLYEQGLEVAHTGTPMGWATSLGIHESQSRMWENMIGRSRAFWEHYYAELQTTFPSLADVALDDFYFAINTVAPSFIRVEADEVTYNLHIMLRFDIERRMMSGKLAVNDVPEAWNNGMHELLGITPENDAQGCLQDIHWSMGGMGYFPTYALGNLYAAQFFAAARKALPNLDDQVRAGDLVPLREWLRENIHKHGQRYRARDLVKVVTGEELSHRAFMDYLNGKFKPLYGI